MLETVLLLTVYAAVPAAILLFLVRHKINGAMQSVGAFILFVSVCTVITAHDPSNVWLLGLGAIVSLAFAAYGYSEFDKFWRRTKEDQIYLQQERDHVKIDRNHLQQEHDIYLTNVASSNMTEIFFAPSVSTYKKNVTTWRPSATHCKSTETG
jgi:hypothetical protein